MKVSVACCDVAYSISINRWQGEQRLQLELKAIRAHTELVLIDRGTRQYTAQLTETSGLKLTNGEGETLHPSPATTIWRGISG